MGCSLSCCGIGAYCAGSRKQAKSSVEARRNHARAAEDPVKRTGVHAQPLLPEEERYRAALLPREMTCSKGCGASIGGT